jgi:hypothetical protein
MRVNVYAEEMTKEIEIISKVIDGHTFTGLRLYLHMPVTQWRGDQNGDLPVTVERSLLYKPEQYDKAVVQAKGPFMHRPGDDDSSAVTFWGKRDLLNVLNKMVEMLELHYEMYDV